MVGDEAAKDMSGDPKEKWTGSTTALTKQCDNHMHPKVWRKVNRK
jgi:hypothetical protein